MFYNIKKFKLLKLLFFKQWKYKINIAEAIKTCFVKLKLSNRETK